MAGYISNNTLAPEDLGLISLVDEIDKACQILREHKRVLEIEMPECGKE